MRSAEESHVLYIELEIMPRAASYLMIDVEVLGLVATLDTAYMAELLIQVGDRHLVPERLPHPRLLAALGDRLSVLEGAIPAAGLGTVVDLD